MFISATPFLSDESHILPEIHFKDVHKHTEDISAYDGRGRQICLRCVAIRLISSLSIGTTSRHALLLNDLTRSFGSTRESGETLLDYAHRHPRRDEHVDAILNACIRHLELLGTSDGDAIDNSGVRGDARFAIGLVSFVANHFLRHDSDAFFAYLPRVAKSVARDLSANDATLSRPCVALRLSSNVDLLTRACDLNASATSDMLENESFVDALIRGGMSVRRRAPVRRLCGKLLARLVTNVGSSNSHRCAFRGLRLVSLRAGALYRYVEGDGRDSNENGDPTKDGRARPTMIGMSEFRKCLLFVLLRVVEEASSSSFAKKNADDPSEGDRRREDAAMMMVPNVVPAYVRCVRSSLTDPTAGVQDLGLALLRDALRVFPFTAEPLVQSRVHEMLYQILQTGGATKLPLRARTIAVECLSELYPTIERCGERDDRVLVKSGGAGGYVIRFVLDAALREFEHVAAASLSSRSKKPQPFRLDDVKSTDEHVDRDAQMELWIATRRLMSQITAGDDDVDVRLETIRAFLSPLSRAIRCALHKASGGSLLIDNDGDTTTMKESAKMNPFKASLLSTAIQGMLTVDTMLAALSSKRRVRRQRLPKTITTVPMNATAKTTVISAKTASQIVENAECLANIGSVDAFLCTCRCVDAVVNAIGDDDAWMSDRFEKGDVLWIRLFRLFDTSLAPFWLRHFDAMPNLASVVFSKALLALLLDSPPSLQTTLVSSVDVDNTGAGASIAQRLSIKLVRSGALRILLRLVSRPSSSSPRSDDVVVGPIVASVFLRLCRLSGIGIVHVNEEEEEKEEEEGETGARSHLALDVVSAIPKSLTSALNLLTSHATTRPRRPQQKQQWEKERMLYAPHHGNRKRHYPPKIFPASPQSSSSVDSIATLERALTLISLSMTSVSATKVCRQNDASHRPGVEWGYVFGTTGKQATRDALSCFIESQVFLSSTTRVHLVSTIFSICAGLSKMGSHVTSVARRALLRRVRSDGVIDRLLLSGVSKWEGGDGGEFLPQRSSSSRSLLTPTERQAHRSNIYGYAIHLCLNARAHGGPRTTFPKELLSSLTMALSSFFNNETPPPVGLRGHLVPPVAFECLNQFSEETVSESDRADLLTEMMRVAYKKSDDDGGVSFRCLSRILCVSSAFRRESSTRTTPAFGIETRHRVLTLALEVLARSTSGSCGSSSSRIVVANACLRVVSTLLLQLDERVALLHDDRTSQRQTKRPRLLSQYDEDDKERTGTTSFISRQKTLVLRCIVECGSIYERESRALACRCLNVVAIGMAYVTRYADMACSSSSSSTMPSVLCFDRIRAALSPDFVRKVRSRSFDVECPPERSGIRVAATHVMCSFLRTRSNVVYEDLESIVGLVLHNSRFHEMLRSADGDVSIPALRLVTRVILLLRSSSCPRKKRVSLHDSLVSFRWIATLAQQHLIDVDEACRAAAVRVLDALTTTTTRMHDGREEVPTMGLRLRLRPWTPYLVAHMIECFRCSSKVFDVGEDAPSSSRRRRPPSSCLRFLSVLLEERLERSTPTRSEREDDEETHPRDDAILDVSRRAFYDHLCRAIASSADPWILPAARFAVAALSAENLRCEEERRSTGANVPQEKEDPVTTSLRSLERSVNVAVRSWELDALPATGPFRGEDRDGSVEFWFDANDRLRQRDREETAIAIRSDALPLLRELSSILTRRIPIRERRWDSRKGAQQVSACL